MFDIDKLINEAYGDEALSFEKLAEMVEDMIILQESLGILSEQAAGTTRPQPITITYEGIPDIPVSELGWASASSKPGEVNVRREQLDAFLAPLKGTYIGLNRTLKKLERYFPRDISVQAAGDVLPRLGTQRRLKGEINDAMSFLIFYKALTEIIRNFNESAAGFSFESFLAVLLGGEQVPTGTGTIADLTDSAGTPISLKLLREGKAMVGGSYSDLVRDLVANQNKKNYKMHYLVCLKDIRGEGLGAKGAVRFYRYYIDKDNFKEIMSQSSTTAPYLQLPQIEIEINNVMVNKTVFYKTINDSLQLVYQDGGRVVPVGQATLTGLTVNEAKAPTFNIGDVEPKYQSIIAKKMKQIRKNLLDLRKSEKLFMDSIKTQEVGTSKINTVEKSLNTLKTSFPQLTSIQKDVDGFLNDIKPDDIFRYYLDMAYYAKDKPSIEVKTGADGKVTYDLQPRLDRTLQQDIAGRVRAKLSNLMFGESLPRLEQWQKKLETEFPTRTGTGISGKAKNATLAVKVISNAFYQGIVKRTYAVIANEYGEALKRLGTKPAQNIKVAGFASTDDSLAILGTLEPTKQQTNENQGAGAQGDEAAYYKTLLLTQGYIKNKNWEFSPAQIVKGMNEAGSKMLKGDQEDGFCGIIYIGVDNVMAFANAIRGQLDDRIFEVFKDLKELTQALESFYNSGLQDKSDAKRASDETDSIKTNVDAMANPGQIAQAAE